MKVFSELFFSLIFIGCILGACNYTSEPENNEEIWPNEYSDNKVLTSTREVFYTLPSPVTTAELIIQSGVAFDSRILNPVRNVFYYETTQSMALNLGLYTVDLSYVCLHNQQQLSIEYLNAVKTLADGLGLLQLLSRDDIIALEEGLFDRDSLKLMVENLFFSSGDFLNDNNRPELALLVQVGSWVEGIYLAMQLARQSIHINKELVDRIVEQYESLLLVIKSLEAFKELSLIQAPLKDMKNLKRIYDRMVITDNNTGGSSPNLVKDAKANVSPELFMSLYHEINKIRNAYTQSYKIRIQYLPIG
jgi:hypothetical protein